MRAGTGLTRFPLEAGTAMMGYGARREPAQGLHDPLHARALYLDGTEEGGARVLLVSLEVCLIAPDQAEAIAAEVASEAGLTAEEIVVACIHTHSGPETGFAERMAGRVAPDHVAPVLAAAVQAGVAATREPVPARFGWAAGETAIGRNRRRADGPVDTRLRVLRVDRESGEPLAIAYLVGCHPTVLGHDNLLWSADWPCAANRNIEEAFPGALPLFLLSAHADIDPRTRGLQDLAIPGQSVGEGFETTEALGREVGEEVVRVARACPAHETGPLGVALGRVPLRAHREEPGEKEAALEALGLPADQPVKTRELYALEAERTAGFEAEERRRRIALVRLHLRNKGAKRFAFGTQPEVPVRLVRVGARRLLALPLEPTVDVGLRWAELTGQADDAVLSIAGGWMRYLPHGRNFEEPGAAVAYEVLNSTFEPGAAEALLARGTELDRAMGEGA